MRGRGYSPSLLSLGRVLIEALMGLSMCSSEVTSFETCFI